MVFRVILWVVASEPIDFEINYHYIYCFERSCDTQVYSFSKVVSMTGIAIIPHILPSVYRIISSYLSKFIEVFVQKLSSALNHSQMLITKENLYAITVVIAWWFSFVLTKVRNTEEHLSFVTCSSAVFHYQLYSQWSPQHTPVTWRQGFPNSNQQAIILQKNSRFHRNGFESLSANSWNYSMV